MKSYFLVSVCAVLLAACQSQKVPTTYYEADTLEYVESVVVDDECMVGYMGTQGDKLDLSGRKGNGQIVALYTENGKPVRRSVTKRGALHSPRAMTLHQGRIYAGDGGRVVSIDPRSGKVQTVANLAKEGVDVIGDATWAGDRMFVVSQKKNSVYEVNPSTRTFKEVKTQAPLNGPSGLAWDAGKGVLYLCEYGSAKKSDEGRLLSLNPVTGEVLRISPRTGRYAGLALQNGELYFSDWNRKTKEQGSVNKMNLETGRIGRATTKEMDNVADFSVTKDGVIVVPALREKKFWIIYPVQGC